MARNEFSLLRLHACKSFWNRSPRRSKAARQGLKQGQITKGKSSYEQSKAWLALALRYSSKRIDIPSRLWGQPLETWQISVRLTGVLRRSGVRVLGDLHGRRVGDFAWERNCGLKTLEELDSLGAVFAKQLSSRNRAARASRKAVAGGSAFAVPKSVRRLRFDELPITKRLATVVRSSGLRTLGDLHGRTRFEVLQYTACGWRTLAEIHQLIERAISGEFDVARIDQSRATAELLSLLEQGMTKLPPRDRQFLLARIGGLSYAEIGRRCGLTRARVHRIVTKALDTLKRAYGPRIPRLLAVV